MRSKISSELQAKPFDPTTEVRSSAFNDTAVIYVSRGACTGSEGLDSYFKELHHKTLPKAADDKKRFKIKNYDVSQMC